MENVDKKLAWENSRHFASPPPVSQRNDVWVTRAEIPYWRVTTQIWVEFLIGWSKFPTRQDQSVALNRSGYLCVVSKEFQRSFLRRHFARKPVMASRNFDSFLRVTRSSFNAHLFRLKVHVTKLMVNKIWLHLHQQAWYAFHLIQSHQVFSSPSSSLFWLQTLGF